MGEEGMNLQDPLMRFRNIFLSWTFFKKRDIGLANKTSLGAKVTQSFVSKKCLLIFFRYCGTVSRAIH